MVDASLLAKREGEEMVVEEGSKVKQEAYQSEDTKLGRDSPLDSSHFAGKSIERVPQPGCKEGAGHPETQPDPPVMGKYPELGEMLSNPPGPEGEGSSGDWREGGEGWGGGRRRLVTGMKCEGNQLWLQPGTELSNDRRMSETLQAEEEEENKMTPRGGSLETPPARGSLVDPLVLSAGPEEGVKSPLETEMEAGLLEALVEPSMALLQPSMTLVQPSMALVQPSMALEQPSRALVQPSMALVQPSMALVQPSMALVQPSMALVEPSITCQGRLVETNSIETQVSVETGPGWRQGMEELHDTSTRLAVANQVRN